MAGGVCGGAEGGGPGCEGPAAWVGMVTGSGDDVKADDFFGSVPGSQPESAIFSWDDPSLSSLAASSRRSQNSTGADEGIGGHFMQNGDLLDQLKNLPPTAFEQLISVPAVAAVVHPAHLPSSQAPQVSRAIELLRAMETAGALDLLRAEVDRAAQSPPMSSSHLVDRELDEIKGFLKERKFEVAHELLTRIERHRWYELSPSPKIRLLNQKAFIYAAQGDPAAASSEYLRAAHISPSDENARINEALAYEFREQSSRAHELADRLVVDFPESNRAFAIWLRTHAQERSAAALEELVTARIFHADAEVCLAVAARAVLQRDFPRADRLARKAISLDEHWPPARLLLGHALAQSVIPDGEPRPRHLSAEQRDRLHQSIDSFGKAADLARGERRPALQVEALTCLARAHDLLDEVDLAERALREADKVKPEYAPLLFCIGYFFNSRKKFDDAVQYLERAYQGEPLPQTGYALALALNGRKRDGDQSRATELFARAALATDPTLSSPALQFAIRGYLTNQKIVEANNLLNRVSPDGDFAVLHHALRGQVLLAANDESGADAQANEALRGWTETCPINGTTVLATLLAQRKRHADALPLWQALFDPERPGYETEALLYCAHTLHRDDILLERCRQLREAGTASPQAQRLEFSLLERYDPAHAVDLLRIHINKNPEDYIARLGLISCELRVGRAKSFDLPLDQLPSAKKIDPAYGELIVNLLREGGREIEAQEYGYQLVRFHYNSLDAHRAYCLSFLADSSDSSRPQIQHVRPGTAIGYAVENNKDSIQWLIIEDGPEPSLLLNEYAPDHPWSQDLMGKHLNEKFQMPGSGTIGQHANIISIQDKYVYRLQDSMQRMTQSFASDSGWAAIHTPEINKPDVAPEVALKPLFAHLDLSTQQDRLAFETYQSQPLSMHLFAALSGRSPFEACAALIWHESIGIHCWSGTPALETAIEWLRQKPAEIVIDLSAIVTIFELGKLDILITWPIRFLVSQGTVEEIRKIVRNNRPSPRKQGSLAPMGRSYCLIERSANEQRQLYNTINNLLETVTQHCEVCGGRQLAAVDPDTRESLLRGFGQHGAESLTLAHDRNCPLWTDDALLALFGAHKWNIRRVWTQSAFQSRIGTEDDKTLIDITARLVGWSYRVTNFSFSVIMRAGEISNWHASARPLKQVIEALASESTSTEQCSQAILELIFAIEEQTLVNSSAQATYRIMMENLRRRPGGAAAISRIFEKLPAYIRQRIRLAGSLALGGER